VAKRLQVLFLTHRLPYAPNRGDRLRAYHILRALQGAAETTLISLTHDAEEAARAGELDGLAARTAVAPVPTTWNHVRAAAALLTSRPLTSVLLDSPAVLPSVRRLLDERRADVVLAFCSSMARFALEPPLAALPLVIDMVDADSAKWRALAEHSRWPKRWIYRREARTLAAFEAHAMRRAYATVAVNEREVALLRALAPDARIEVLENGVDLGSFAPPHAPADSTRVVFCGVMNYAPNEAGAVWLARDVWPRVRAAVPNAELRIVGASPTPTVQGLASASLGIVVTGAVPDVRPELWAAAVATAPLQTARGVQNKVLEAVAAGLPCVVTPAVHDGLPPEALPACQVTAGAEAFAAAITSLLARRPDDRRRLATVDLEPLSWQRRLSPLLPLLREAAACAPRG
jgi:sugar transferase (PEP-CTERM/EpsH1 system associated)